MTTSFWSFGITWWTVSTCAVFAAISIWLFVLNARRYAHDRGIIALEFLRIVITALILVTFFRPERVSISKKTEQPLVAVLCDMSHSMTTSDILTNKPPAESRLKWINDRRQERFWAPLEKKYKVVVDNFAVPPAGTNQPAGPAGTDINLAIEKTMARYSTMRAVLLLSDGDWNTGKSPVISATKLALRDIPVFAITVGSEKYLPDLELQAVAAPAYGLMDEHISLPFTIQSHLPRDVRTTVSLYGENNVEARKDIVIPAMGQFQDSIILIPRSEGTYRFTLKLPAEKDEVFDDNNTKEFQMAIRKETLKVLVVDSLPRWEYRFLHNALSRDPGVSVSCLLLHPSMKPGEGLDYIPSFPSTKEDLSKFDVIFIGDVGIGSGELTKENAEMLKGLVEQQGSGLVFLPGNRGREGSLVSSPLGDLMPVELDTAKPAGFGFGMESRLALTAAGSGHLLTMLASDPSENISLWKRLPGFFWHAPVVKAKPGTDVLAVHSEARNQHGRLPLLVTRTCGNGKVLFMGTDSAWRWRRGVEDTYHYRFWGQVVRWMAHQRHLAHSEGIRFFYSPESPRRGDSVFLHATIYDQNGLPFQGGTVQASITAANGQTDELTLSPEPGGWGVFTGSFSPREGGKHNVALKCPEAGRSIKAQFVVSTPQLEQTGRPVRSSVLTELASITRGKCGAIQDLGKIVQEINLLPEPRPVEERLRLWCHPLWCALIIGLLGVYWAGRKLLGMI